MAELTQKLPPHCRIKPRKNCKGRVVYADVYFMVHPKDRPKKWPATIHLGRTDRKSMDDIITKANQTYADYQKFKFEAATGERIRAPQGSLADVIVKYKESQYWSDLSKRTRKDYLSYLDLIYDWSERAGHPHIKHMQPKSITKWLNGFDETPVRQKRARTVLSIVYGAAIREGYINSNIVKDIKLRRRKTEKRKVSIWTDEDIEKLINKADELGWSSIGTAALIAYESGQRQGDVLSMQKPRDYNEGRFRFYQNKTGQWMEFRATKRLKARLSRLPDEQLLLVRHENTGKQWKGHTFTHMFRRIADACGLENHIFMHFRHSAVLNLEASGCTHGQIANITGHSLQTVNTILEVYRTRSTEVADAAIMRLESYRKAKSKTNQ